MDGDARLLRRPLDDHLRDARLGEAVHDVVPQIQVVVQTRGIVAVRIPARIPGSVYAEPEPDRVDLMAHYSASLRSPTFTVRLLNGFSMRPSRPRARACTRSDTNTAVLQS